MIKEELINKMNKYPNNAEILLDTGSNTYDVIDIDYDEINNTIIIL